MEKRKPLNKFVYTLLSNTELKRKMKEHGLSIKGERQVRIENDVPWNSRVFWAGIADLLETCFIRCFIQTLVQRHKEFTIIYNSECSKPRPKSGRF